VLFFLHLTLSPNLLRISQTALSRFFSNTGAVAGVFVLVGLAAASILLWIFFAVRRRRRTRRLEHDTAVSATLAAAGFNRALLDEDDDIDPRASASGSNVHGYSSVGAVPRRSSSGLGMSVPSGSGSGRMSHVYAETTPFHDDPAYAGDMTYNPHDQPYASLPANAAMGQRPPSAFHMGSFRDRTRTPPVGALPAGATSAALGGLAVATDRDRRISGATTASNPYDEIAVGPPFLAHHQQQSTSSNSGANNEPLLAGYRGGEPGSAQAKSMTGTPAQLPPPYAPIPHSHQAPSSTSSSPRNLQPQTAQPEHLNVSRESLYSTGSAPLVMTGIAITSDDRHVNDDPFAANAYIPPLGPLTVVNNTNGNGTRHDDRLDARMLDWGGDADSARDLRDEEDYTRRVLPHGTAGNSLGNSEGSIRKVKGGQEKTLGVRNATEHDFVG